MPVMACGAGVCATISRSRSLPVSSSVTNRSGGEHIVAYTYLSQRPGDAHAIGVMSTPMLLNPIEGPLDSALPKGIGFQRLQTPRLLEPDTEDNLHQLFLGPEQLTEGRLGFFKQGSTVGKLSVLFEKKRPRAGMQANVAGV